MRRAIRTVLAAVAMGAASLALGGGGGVARAATGVGPQSPDERVRPVDPGLRAGLRAAYPYVPPAPVGPSVPAVCLQRPHIVCASKSEKTLRYFESGSLWLSTPVAYGRPGYETPTGLYTVRVKDANAWSWEFNAPLPYSLEYDLVRGIYIHYSSTYASIGPGYIGSHGCINIGDLTTAKTLFNRVPLGAAVYVY